MIYESKKTKLLADAISGYGESLYRDDSSYPLPRAQRALSGKSHYVDDATLRGFDAKVLRCITSHHGFYLLIQESLPHPDNNWGRVRRNVLFDVFGTVVTDRHKWHKSARFADKEFSELCALMDSEFACVALKMTLQSKIAYDKNRLSDASKFIGRGNKNAA